jgi:hypothetical protein
MWDLMKGSKYKPFFEHFLIAAGRMDGEHRGAKWNDDDFYKWIEAACSVLVVTDDAQLARTIDAWVEVMGQAQRADGYIHTPVLIANRHGIATAQPFQDRHNFEMYNMGHLITAACLHHRVTGEDSFLDIAKKTATREAAADRPSMVSPTSTFCDFLLLSAQRASHDRSGEWLHVCQTTRCHCRQSLWWL